MMPRFITEIENTYNAKFPDSTATMFYPYSKEERPAFEALLQAAISRNKPVTRDELLALYEDSDGFEGDLDLLSEWYDLPKEKILEGLA